MTEGNLTQRHRFKMFNYHNHIITCQMQFMRTSAEAVVSGHQT